MSEQLDLTTYLHEQAGEGTKESEGDFTISHENARRKLAKFALPRDTAWVSKLVQSAVGWKMNQILAAQSRTETQFFFFTDKPSDLPTEDDIVQNLLSGEVVADSPIEHFCLALRALVEQAGLSFILVINDGEMKPRPVYAGPYYGQRTEDERLGTLYNREVGVTLTVRHAPEIHGHTRVTDLIQQSRYSVPIAEELRKYAYTCPIPINLSGMHIEGFLDSGLFSELSVPLYFSGLRALENSPPHLPLPPCYEEKQLSFLTHPRRARRKYGGENEFAAAFLLSSRTSETLLRRPSRMSSFNWIRDGIVIQTDALEVYTLAIALHIYVNAEGLSSDLTGFQLTESDEKTAREREALTKVSEALGEVSGKVDRFFVGDTDALSHDDEQIDKDAAYRKRLKTVVAGSGVGAFLGLFNPMLGMTTALGIFAKTFIKNWNVLDDGKGAEVSSARPLLRTTIDSDIGSIRGRLESLASEQAEG